jgi:hypothetical protein
MTNPLSNVAASLYQCIGGPHDGLLYAAGLGVMPTMTIKGARYELTRQRRQIGGHWVWQTVLLSADLKGDDNPEPKE